jgi:hypothetical protein
VTQLLNDSIERREKTPVPEWVERVCADFGVTDSGLPRFRVMWNPDRRRKMNILNPETNSFIVREVLKYPRVGERWILEELMPWERFGKWHEEAFGPKPPDGEYCLSHTIQYFLLDMMQNPAGEESEFLSLDDFGADNLRLLLHACEKVKALQAWQLRNYELEMIEREEKEFGEQFDTVYDDNMGELRKLEKLQDAARIYTSLDPLPRAIEAERRRKARQRGRAIVQTSSEPKE